jgi:hypothetical protein
MKKSDWQYLVDTLLFINILGIVFIGFLLGLILPKGPSVAESEKYFLGLHRHDWGDIHFFLSIAFTALVIIHLIFSWKWIKAKAKQIFKTAWLPALISTSILALATPLLIWSFWPKYAEKYAEHGLGTRAINSASYLSGTDTWEDQSPVHSQEDQGYIVVTGQMTLADVEKAAGLSAQEIKEELGLPKRVRTDETFGRLRKRYGVQLQDIRDIIAELLAANSSKFKLKESEPEGIVPTKPSAGTDVPEEIDPVEEEHENKLTRGRLAEDPAGVLITGQMTLLDIQHQTGIPSRTIAEKLGLPTDILLSDHLGRLRRRYGFTIQEVRDIISALLEKN